jgi:hypothetical protein
VSIETELRDRSVVILSRTSPPRPRRDYYTTPSGSKQGPIRMWQNHRHASELDSEAHVQKNEVFEFRGFVWELSEFSFSHRTYCTLHPVSLRSFVNHCQTFTSHWQQSSST